MIVGSGWPPGPKGPKRTAQAAIARRMTPENMMSFQTAHGTNGSPSLWTNSSILLQIGFASNDAAGHRPFVDAQFQHQKDMQGDEGDQQSGNYKNVHCKKA